MIQVLVGEKLSRRRRRRGGKSNCEGARARQERCSHPTEPRGRAWTREERKTTAPGPGRGTGATAKVQPEEKLHLKKHFLKYPSSHLLLPPHSCSGHLPKLSGPQAFSPFPPLAIVTLHPQDRSSGAGPHVPSGIRPLPTSRGRVWHGVRACLGGAADRKHRGCRGWHLGWQCQEGQAQLSSVKGAEGLASISVQERKGRRGPGP